MEAKRPKMDVNSATATESNAYSESEEKIPSSRKLKKKEIVVTKCLKNPCPRSYTDAISETFLILCRDPIHNTLQSDNSFSNNSGAGHDSQAHKRQTTRFGVLPYDISL